MANKRHRKSTHTVVMGMSGLWLGFVICLLATLFLLYEFILQVSPSVITRELMQNLKLTEVGLGAMTAFYYYAYTPMQLPAGLLLDRFGPRKMLTLATLACAFGALCFGVASELWLAAIGRLMMGIGSAFAFIGTLVLVARWFPPHYFAISAGVVQLSASLGAIVGQVALSKLIHSWGWRDTILGLGLFGIGLTGLLAWVIRDSPVLLKGRSKSTISFKQEGKRLWTVLANRQTWWIGLYSLLVWAPITAFAALWGIPFLIKAYALNTVAASNACAMIWLGVGVGSPLLGWWSDAIARRILPLTLSALLGAFSLFLVLYYPLSYFWLYVSLFILGLGSSGQALAFGLIKDNHQKSVVGAAIGFNNMAVVASGAVFQPLIGFLLAWNWDGLLVSSSSGYSLDLYKQALVVLPLCYLAAALGSHFCLRESYCKPRFSQ